MAPKKRNPPCTGSNDKMLLKNGCPEKYWDGQEGCPKWKEYTIPGKPGEQPAIIKGCTDILMEHWQFEALKMLEGNQIATETFRNGMVETGPDGQVYPKANPIAINIMAQTYNAQQSLVNDVREPKLIKR